VPSQFAVGGLTLGLVSGDLLAAGAGSGLDQVLALVVDAQSRVVDFDGDDLAGVAQPDLDALADDLRTVPPPASPHRRYRSSMATLEDGPAPEPWPGPRPQPAPTAGLDYVRRMYDRAIDWYKTAETKAQLLLTSNGAFATILFGIVSSHVGELRQFGRVSGVETWCFLAVAVIAFCGAIGLAAASLLSRHQHNIDTDFSRLGLRRDDPTTYKPEATWYFGHLASLRFESAVDLLRTADGELEFEALTYNVVGLSHVVLRKHRLINAGWMLAAGALVAMIAAGLSLFLRSQL
jgi:hypothetical protein